MPQTPDLVLYFAPGASSMAPHIALHEIGVPFEARRISFANNESRSPEYLAINLHGQVPTLLVDGRPLTEVAAILFYLARRFPEADLAPLGDPEAEAQVLSWMSFLASRVHPSGRQGQDQARAMFGEAEARLGGRAWALGRYSIVDIHLFRLFWRFRKLLDPQPGEFADLWRHFEAVRQRPAVQKTIEIESAFGYELPPSVPPI